VPWEKGGGQETALQHQGRDRVPLVCILIFQKFNMLRRKGFLLYGPPGCGKTLSRQGD